MTTIDYFMSCISPWTYLGHAAAREIAARHGARLNVKPVNLGELFKVTGQVGLADRPPARQRYRLIELQRYAEMRGRKLNLKPKHFPTDPSLADHTVIVLLEAGSDPLDYMEAVLSAIWAEEHDIADETTLSQALQACGFDAAHVLEQAKSPEIAAIRAANSADAIALDAIGVPSFVLNGEPFWGQDRLDMLDRALSTGRAAYRSA